jgi:hypothetical protein
LIPRIQIGQFDLICGKFSAHGNFRFSFLYLSMNEKSLNL